MRDVQSIKGEGVYFLINEAPVTVNKKECDWISLKTRAISKELRYLDNGDSETISSFHFLSFTSVESTYEIRKIFFWKFLL